MTANFYAQTVSIEASEIPTSGRFVRFPNGVSIDSREFTTCRDDEGEVRYWYCVIAEVRYIVWND